MSERILADEAIEFDDDGFLANFGDWDEELARRLAAEIGIDPLTEEHWKVIDFSRTDFLEQGEAPTLRRITKVGGVPTKVLYRLFPKGPAKKVAYVSGLKKPSGCI